MKAARRHSRGRAGCACDRVQRLQPARLDWISAFLADPVQAPLHTVQYLFDCRQLILSGIVNCLQGFVVLQLDCPIALVADQGLAASLQVRFDPLVALNQGPLPGQKGLFDVGQTVLWNRHVWGTPIRAGAGKMARRL